MNRVPIVSFGSSSCGTNPSLACSTTTLNVTYRVAYRMVGHLPFRIVGTAYQSNGKVVPHIAFSLPVAHLQLLDGTGRWRWRFYT